MKFLLEQSLIIKQEQTIFFLYPNKFSRQIVKEAKDKNLILDINYTYSGKYRVVQSYEILENDFKRLLYNYKRKIHQKRAKFFARPYLEQLILILKYVFKRNNRAKEVLKRSAKYKAYDDKDEFLRLALNIAQNIDQPQFKYGWAEDPGTINFEYVYYFEFRGKQVSFHSDKLYLEIPEFKGNWIGYRNESFPFALRNIRYSKK